MSYHVDMTCDVILSDLESFNNTKYLCGVFYHKLEEINHWKVTLAFFPENKQQVL